MTQQNERISRLVQENKRIMEKMKELDDMYWQYISILDTMYWENIREMAEAGDETAVYRVMTYCMHIKQKKL